MHKQKEPFSGGDTKLNYKKYVSNQNGLTFVELMATIIISSIVIILLFNILSGAQKEANRQSNKNVTLMDVSYGFKDLTKKIQTNRDSYVDYTNPLSPILVIRDEEYTFDKEHYTIIKTVNGTISSNYLTNVEEFDVQQHGNLITIRLISTLDKDKEYITKIAVN